MNDPELEQRLRDLPDPALPSPWRASILKTARREARPSRPERNWPVLLLWLAQACRGSPVTAVGLATLWLAILLLKSVTPLDPMVDRLLARAETTPPPSLLAVREREQLTRWLQDDDIAPAQVPLQP